MRIACIHNRYIQPGGEDAVFEAEVRLLRERGHDVVIYEEDNRRVESIPRVRLAVGTVWSREHYAGIQRFLESTRPDVAHFHNFFPLISPAAYYACERLRTPVVQTLHNYRLLCPAATFYRKGAPCEECLHRPPLPGVWYGCYRGSRIQTAAVAAMLVAHRLAGTWDDRVDAYVALSRFARNKFIAGGLPRSKLHVKPNFVDPDPGPRDGVGSYAIFVGRLSPEKGIGTLLSASARCPALPLKIVGDGPLMATVREAADRREGNVEALGRRSRDELFALLRGARFLVLPSECYENFPMAVVEAFACGVPVVGSRLGALAELVVDGHTGLLFTPGDAADLASKMERAWSSRVENTRMGRQARLDYLSKYTADTNARQLEGIYRAAGERAAQRHGLTVPRSAPGGPSLNE